MAHICSCSLLVFTTALGPPPPTLTDKDKDVGSENLDLATFKPNEHNGKYQTHRLILIICCGTQ